MSFYLNLFLLLIDPLLVIVDSCLLLSFYSFLLLGSFNSTDTRSYFRMTTLEILKT